MDASLMSGGDHCRDEVTSPQWRTTSTSSNSSPTSSSDLHTTGSGEKVAHKWSMADNTSTIAHTKEAGGHTRSLSQQIAMKILVWWMQKEVHLSADPFQAAKSEIRAPKLSRDHDHTLVNQLNSFPTWRTDISHLPQFVSLIPDVRALAEGCLSLNLVRWKV